MFKEPAECLQIVVTNWPRCWHATQDVDESIAVDFLKYGRHFPNRLLVEAM
ncbi:hypothetical protein ACSDR0_31385 [Streptosporangium sp. G11]|uniref:hypothetical protein n=1 Tax=Streptosporangium sp. G11 TaxID=3436926 RepID=UPI003EBDD9F1